MWHRRAGVALRTMARKTGLTSLGESLITRMISALAVCWSSASARAFSSRLSSPASRLRDSVSRLSDFSRASTLASSAAFVTCVMDTLLRQGAGPGAVSSRQLPHLRLRLLQPVRHAHLAVHRRRGGEVLLRLLSVAGAPVELAEAEVAVGDEGPHAARLGERQRLAVVGLAPLGIEPVGMCRDVAKQVQHMGGISRLRLRRFSSSVAQAARLVQLAEHQVPAP